MKKNLFIIFVLSMCIILPAKVYPQNSVGTNEKDTAYWNRMADGMTQALTKHFWGANFEGYPARYYFNYGSDLSDLTTNHYWPQAHAMDVIVDAYERTSEDQYLDFYPLWWEGAPAYNFSGKDGDPWWNEFVDDMEWMALTQLRMFETTQRDEYFLKAQQLYDDWIWSTWGPETEEPWKGGITWKTDVRKSKNACSNGPAAIIAARIYNMYDEVNGTGEKPKQAYLDESIKIYTWLRDHLYDQETGKVRDNMNDRGEISPAVIRTTLEPLSEQHMSCIRSPVPNPIYRRPSTQRISQSMKCRPTRVFYPMRPVGMVDYSTGYSSATSSN